jgi:hypothetical protein
MSDDHIVDAIQEIYSSLGNIIEIINLMTPLTSAIDTVNNKVNNKEIITAAIGKRIRLKFLTRQKL